jgi:hypothetical protein
VLIRNRLDLYIRRRGVPPRNLWVSEAGLKLPPGTSIVPA